MKKLYAIITLVALAFTANAANHYVFVGVDGTGTPNNVYTPASTNAVVGDSVYFILGSGVHTVNSTSVPSGAAAINSGTMSTFGQMYGYLVTHAGTYPFQCNFHAGMAGTINAVSSGINEPTPSMMTTAYPNPFTGKITIKYHNIQSIEVINVIGEKVRKIDLSATETKAEIDFESLPSGVYFYRTYNEGAIVETKKIVKAK